MQSTQASGAGQNVQSANDSDDSTGTEGAQAAASTPTPSADAASQFATQTLASLLNYQQGSSWASSTASQLIGQLDGDGNGQLSLSEVEKALGADTSAQQSGVSQAFAQIDTDGDGEISQSELAAALSSQQQAQGGGGPHGVHGHRHHHEAATATQAAQDIINTLDPNGGGSLSLDALESDLGLSSTSSTSGTSATSSSTSGTASTQSSDASSTSSSAPTGSSSQAGSTLAQAFARLDTNGDGQLSASELAGAIQAFRQAQEASWSTSWTNSMAGLSAAV